MIKVLKAYRKDGTHFKIIKATFNKSMPMVIWNGNKLRAFTLKSEWDNGVHSLLLCDIVLKLIAIAVSEEKDIKK